MKQLLLPAMLCLLMAADPALAAPKNNQSARSVDADFARGIAEANADYADGRQDIYVHHHSNMPNGPDAPALARQDSLLLAIMMEKGISPRNSNTGSISNPGFYRFAQGYNSVAESKLQAKYGSDYMLRLKDEATRRMQQLPQAAGMPGSSAQAGRALADDQVTAP